MINFSLSELALLLNLSPLVSEKRFTGLSTDTRTLVAGNLYIAIKGDHFDGHDFIQTAYDKGAAAAIVNRPISCPLSQLQVKDTVQALGRISAAWRNNFSLPLIGLTGSNGKTTLKNMLASILTAACSDNPDLVLATQGNLNNHIGVPLTLARLNAKHRFGVIEMGMNHGGEISYLTQLAKPHIAVITNAAAAHLAGLQTVAKVATAKAEIFLGLPAEGVAILNREDDFYPYWVEYCQSFKRISFALNASADVTAELLKQDGSKQIIKLLTPVGNIEIILNLIGKHNILNALAACAASIALGIDLNNIKAGLEKVKPASGRLTPHNLPNDIHLLDDTYNANPFSVAAALNALSIFHGKKILVLGDMKELGENAKDFHANIAAQAHAAGITHLFTLGELSRATAERFGENAKHFNEHSELTAALKPLLTQGNTTILVKGSRSMRMEKIVAELLPNEEN